MHRTHVTTADSIDGWEVQEHLGIVASHAVAGTGVFSDIFAGFSDFFGGRSNSYRKQLASLYRDTTDDLMRQAQARGGNWLLGLKIDLDEVSGKGTQMFMITGLATAVRASQSSGGQAVAAVADDSVTADELSVTTRRRALVPRLSDPEAHLTEADLELLDGKTVIEACPALIRQYGPTMAVIVSQSVTFRERVHTLLARADANVVSRLLYDALIEPQTADGAVELIVKGGFGSLREVSVILKGSTTEAKRAALQTLKASQPSYSRADVALIDHLLALVPSTFPDLTTKVETKGMLGGASTKWQCPCGKSNSLDARYCGKCYEDSMGFKQSEISPASATNLLTSLREDLIAALDY